MDRGSANGPIRNILIVWEIVFQDGISLIARAHYMIQWNFFGMQGQKPQSLWNMSGCINRKRISAQKSINSFHINMSNQKPNPGEIIDAMMEKDYFSQWLNLERLEEGPGFCSLKMKIRKEMCNGFEIAHGGIAYSIADSALAFASNSHGDRAVSMETSISHIKSLVTGDIIIARAKEIHRGRRIGIYEVRVEKENGELVALFKGTVFIK